MAKFIETKEDKEIEFYTKDSVSGRVKRVAEFSIEGSGLIIGSAGYDGASGSLSDNIKLHRGGVQILQVLKGDDSTPEGVLAPPSSLAAIRGVFTTVDVPDFATAVRSSVVLNTMVGSQTDQAGSVFAVKEYVADSLIPNDEAIVDLKDSAIPVGAISPWMGGYFTAAGNGGSYIDVLGGGVNTIAAANAYLNPHGYYVCNGVAVNIIGSAVFNGPGRYVPDLTDSRFIQGSTSFGVIGGSNNLTDHTHTFSLSLSHSHSINHSHAAVTVLQGVHSHLTSYAASHRHTHTIYNNNGGGSGGPEVGLTSDNTTQIFTEAATHTHPITPTSHTHNVNFGTISGYTSGATNSAASGTIGSGSPAVSTEKRPKYLSAIYIIKVK